MVEIRGSMVALVTPFCGDVAQTVDDEKLAQLVQFHEAQGTSGIVLCGTTGEAPTLSHAEQDQVIRVGTAAAKGMKVKIIAGTGSNSTREAVRLTATAAEAGVEACLVVTPYYNKPTPRGVLAHFRELDKIGIPLIVYNIPSRTGINLEPQVLFEIAEACPNVIGVKASNGDLDQITATAQLFRANEHPFSILSGDDSLTLPILAVGGVGVISVAANVMPRVMRSLVSTFCEDKDLLAAAHLMQTIHGFCRSLLTSGANPEPVKAVMNQLGMAVGGCRLPLVELARDQTNRLMAMAREMVQELDKQNIDLDEKLRGL